MKTKVKKLFNGFASVRDYIIKKCVDKREDLVIEYDGDSMTIPLSTLIRPFQIHKTKFKSKFNKGSYTLYDFKWGVQ
jgi:hypothetical protein